MTKIVEVVSVFSDNHEVSSSIRLLCSCGLRPMGEPAAAAGQLLATTSVSSHGPTKQHGPKYGPEQYVYGTAAKLESTKHDGKQLSTTTPTGKLTN